MLQLIDYRRNDLQDALATAAGWVLTNQFPTWFRLLSLALTVKALPEHPLALIPWQFPRCPGMQFWGNALPHGLEGASTRGAMR
ncbi:hypothetical protein HQ520_04375 [bacterium]|nr:hypothetical protein [bacterium]